MKKLSVLFFALTLVSCGGSDDTFTASEASLMYSAYEQILEGSNALSVESDLECVTIADEETNSKSFTINNCEIALPESLTCSQTVEDLTLSGTSTLSTPEESLVVNASIEISGGALNGKACTIDVILEDLEDEDSITGTICGIDAAELVDPATLENEELCAILFGE